MKPLARSQPNRMSPCLQAGMSSEDLQMSVETPDDLEFYWNSAMSHTWFPTEVPKKIGS